MDFCSHYLMVTSNLVYVHGQRDAGVNLIRIKLFYIKSCNSDGSAINIQSSDDMP